MERRTDEEADAGRGVVESSDEDRDGGVRGSVATEPHARFDRGRVFRVAAWLLFAAAPLLLYFGRAEAAFLVASLGAAAWFLGVRTALIRKHDLVKVGGRNWRPRREVEKESAGDVEED